jgi:hypothetical protein
MLSSARVCFLTVALAAHASAIPVTWTLSGVLFGDGGGVTGSFVYDATTNTFSSVNIISTSGSLPGGTTGGTYITAAASSNSNVASFLTATTGDLTGTPRLSLTFPTVDLLSNSPRTISIVSDAPSEGRCSNATCTNLVGPERQITIGFVIGVVAPPAVPAPSTLPLVVGGLMFATMSVQWKRWRFKNRGR